MTFSISVTRILENIYGVSAMYTLLNHHDKPPRMLRSDHRAMLDKAVRLGFSKLCFRLLPFIDNCDLDDDEILTLDLKLPSGFPSTGYRVIQAALEDVVMGETLAQAYAGYDTELSDRNTSSAAKSLQRIRSSLAAGPCNAALTPSLF